jgi:mannose-6-phosphate isomerase-like protein (cupin superfamily)
MSLRSVLLTPASCLKGAIMPTDLKEIFRIVESNETEEEKIHQIINNKDGYGWGLASVKLRACPRHYHKQTTEIYVIVDGSIKLELDGAISTLAVGDHVSIRPGAIHRVFDGEEAHMMVFSFPPFTMTDYFEA